MGHEATVSKVSEDQLFYLMSRGLTEDEAMAMIVRGFVEPIARELPMEYALELNRLIELQMEGAGRLMSAAHPAPDPSAPTTEHAQPRRCRRSPARRAGRPAPPPPGATAVAGLSRRAPHARVERRRRHCDLADFPVPTGREEEWRFTPLARLRGLLDGRSRPTGADRRDRRARPGRGARGRRRRDDRGRHGVLAPADRVAALALERVRPGATCVTVPKGTAVAEPVTIDAARRGRLGVRPPGRRRRQPFAEAVVVLDHVGSARAAPPTSSFGSATAPR